MNGMFLIEGLLIVLILICGGVAAWTDFRKSKIPNKLLIRILLPTAVLNIVYYSCYVRDSFDFYLINLGLTTVFSLAFYVFHIWAAGDSKLLFVLVFDLRHIARIVHIRAIPADPVPVIILLMYHTSPMFRPVQVHLQVLTSRILPLWEVRHRLETLELLRRIRLQHRPRILLKDGSWIMSAGGGRMLTVLIR
jgi:Flp pilus assembly protein protease CpaA